MSETKSLLTDDLKLVRIDHWKIKKLDSGILSCPATISWQLNAYHKEQIQDSGVLDENFERNPIEWCWRSSLWMTSRPFNPKLINLEWDELILSWDFISYLWFEQAFQALNVWNDVWRLLVNTKRFQINNPTTLDILMRQEYWQAFRVHEWSRIVKFNEIVDENWDLLFPNDDSYWLEIPLINSLVKWDEDLLSNVHYLTEAISQWRNAISRLIDWQRTWEDNIAVTPLSFFLWWIELNLNWISAIIQENLNHTWLIHVNARFIDWWRSWWNLNEIRCSNWKVLFRNTKFVELFNFKNQTIALNKIWIYLKLWDPYPDSWEKPWSVRKIDTSWYVWLYWSLAVSVVQSTLSSLWGRKSDDKDFGIIVQDWKIFTIPWRDSLKFQCNTIEYPDKKYELKHWDIKGLSEIANHLRMRFWGEWESKIAFFKFIPPIEIIESLKQIWIRQIIVENMQIWQDAFNWCDEEETFFKSRDAISNSNLLNIFNNTRTWAIKLYRLRDWILEEFKHMLWWAQSSFDRLESKDTRFWIWIYWWSWSNPEKAKQRFLWLFEKLNKLFKNQCYIVHWRCPWSSEWANNAAVEAWILSIWVWANLSSEQKTIQKPHLELVTEWANRLDRQSIITKLFNIPIADLFDRPSTWTEWEINDEITGLCLRERPLTPLFILWDPDNNEFASIVKNKINLIMQNLLHKWNTDLDKFIIFCKNEHELEEKFIEFLSSPNVWYEKYWINSKLVEEWRMKWWKWRDIWWPVNELFDY